ncbi:amidohydrolase [Chelativorans sp. SCAU2101]|uniref:Amidohydrolase n=1 Tax=Chelativorans petroleitrophicus TaxID=2975484 RepID=A0A9X2X9M1_9HYPH|nr:amidohydrolase [Chelativorans petroleitrophicus]MCT8990137.1 amidohydrolase [Chelativorans petroleitrophicus]
MIVDTHLHVIDQSVLAYPWLSGTPALNRNFSYETYAREAKRVGIEATLHMEVDVAASDMEAETENVARLVDQPGSLIVGAIAACRPEDETFPAYLERHRDNPLIRGFRRVLHVMPDDLSERPLFRENIRRLSGTGLTFDLCVLPRQLPQTIALVDLAPDVQFILDHCGVPDIKSEEMHPWRELMSEIARRPNVAGKISGVIAYADPETWTVETLRPWVEHTIEVFDWDRVVWGSDWPVCTQGGSLSTWVAATHALIAGASEEERRKLLSQNARRIWRL